MNINKETANAVATEIDAAVRAILTKHGLEPGKTTIGCGEWFDYKIVATALTLGENGVNMTSKEATYYSKFGYTAYAGEDDFTGIELTAPLGTKFTHLVSEYAFAGVDSKKRKNPIMALDLKTGKTVYFSDKIVARINESVKAGA